MQLLLQRRLQWLAAWPTLFRDRARDDDDDDGTRINSLSAWATQEHRVKKRKLKTDLFMVVAPFFVLYGGIFSFDHYDIYESDYSLILASNSHSALMLMLLLLLIVFL